MSTQETNSPGAEDARHLRRQRRRRRRRKAGLWSLISMAAMAGAATLLLLSYLGTPITVPDWLRTRLTERINQNTGEIRVELGEMVVVIEEGWIPRLSLRDVVLRGPDGMRLANLSELGGRLAMRPLLRGEVQPGSIRVSGVQLILRRDRSGAVDVALVGAETAADDPRGATGITAIIQRIDDALQRPELSALERITADNLTLRYEDARAGRAWNVDGGQLSLTREDDDLRIRGNFALLGARDYATSLEMNYASRIGEVGAEFGVNIQDVPADDISGQSPALAWLAALDAPISGALRVQIEDDGTLGPLNATLQIGAGVLQPTEATKPIAFSSVRSYFTYTPKSQMIRFESLSISSSWVTARAEGTAFLVGVQDGWPSELQAQMRVTGITADPADLYPEPIQIDVATMDMRLQLEPFHLSLGQMSLSDQGRQLILSGDLKAEETGWDLALDGRMDGLSHDRLLALWPEAAAVNTRKWIAENVQAASLSNLQLAVRSRPKHRPDLFLGFDYEDLNTRFMKEMPHIEGAVGHASLYDGRFVIRAEEGRIKSAQGGYIDIAGTSFVVPDVWQKHAVATVDLETESTITAALALLDEKPFEFLSKQGRPVTLADGRARLSGHLGFPLAKKVGPDDVVFDVTGDLSEVRSAALVPGRVLSAAAMSVRADNETLEVSGDGLLGQVPFNGRWQSPLGPEGNGKSRLTGWIELSERFADEFGIGLPPGSMSGKGRGDITVDLNRDGTGEFALSSDMAGVGLRLAQLDWALAQAARGQLQVRGRLSTPPQIDLVELDAPGLRARGSIQLQPGGALERALFSRVEVGNWLDAPVELVGRGAELAPAVVVNGGTVDLRHTNLSGGRDASQKKGAPITLKLDRLEISDGLALTDFTAKLDTTRGTEGTFAGRVNGSTAITGSIVPQRGRSAFRIRSDNAGGVLGAAGLLKKANGGDLDLILAPAEEAGTYDGQLEADNVWLADAPALAALLSSLSVVGLLEQMSGNGILFNKVNARFQLSPDRVTLLSSSAVGASMGISMDGYYFMKDGRMDMQGVVSPLYLVNQVGGIFTRQGEGLVGVNYKLKGPAKSPRVQVNPLSILTPGMFREIFRRSPPSVARNATGDVTGAPAPEPDTRKAPNPIKRRDR
nr:AsmA-like C-terminal region-containing protein [uncultured Roseovarius sp.]